jgi:hypothetical protein
MVHTVTWAYLNSTDLSTASSVQRSCLTVVVIVLQKGDSVFHPILLQEVTVFEMTKLIAEIFEVSYSNNGREISGTVFKSG